MLETIKVLDSIRDLPDKLEVEDLIERFILIDKIQKGIDDVASDRVWNEIETENRFRPPDPNSKNKVIIRFCHQTIISHICKFCK
jgi:hypothetical protein